MPDISYDQLRPGDEVHIVVHCRISDDPAAVNSESIAIVLESGKGFVRHLWLHRPVIRSIQRAAA